jgi:hypothetical protein
MVKEDWKINKTDENPSQGSHGSTVSKSTHD